MAVDAQRLFFQRQFSTVVDALSHVLSEQEIDESFAATVRHNVAVSRYYSLLLPENSLRPEAICRNILDEICRCLSVQNDNMGENPSLPKTVTDVSVDEVLDALNPETIVVFFNLSALLFLQHRYEESYKILVKLLVMIENSPETIDCSISLQISFVFLESLLRNWRNAAFSTSEQQYTALQNFASRSISLAERCLPKLALSLDLPAGMSVLVSSYYAEDYRSNDFDGRKDSNNSNLEDSMSGDRDLRVILINIIRYRIQLYHSRISLAVGQSHIALRESELANTFFEECVTPLITEPSRVRVTSPSGSDSHQNRAFITKEFTAASLCHYIGVMSLGFTGAVSEDHLSESECEPDSVAVAVLGVVSELRRQRGIGRNIQAEVLCQLGRKEESLQILREMSYSSTDITSVSAGTEDRAITERDYDYRIHVNIAHLEMKEKRYHSANMSSQQAFDKLKTELLASSSSTNESTVVRRVDISHHRSLSVEHRDPADVLYIAGLAALKSGNPVAAMSYFNLLVDVNEWNVRPSLWVRMAECCITEHHNQQRRQLSSRCSQGFLDVTGPNGRGRRLKVDLLRTDTSTNDDVRNDNNNSNSSNRSKTDCGRENAQQKGYEIENAVQYLETALYLARRRYSLPSSDKNIHHTDGVISVKEKWSSDGDSGSGEKEEKEEKIHTITAKDGTCTSALNDENLTKLVSDAKNRANKLEMTILLQLSYTCLVTGSIIRALWAAEEALRLSQSLSAQPQSPPEHGDCDSSTGRSLESSDSQEMFLARMYAAEALCILNRVEEAAVMMQGTIDEGVDLHKLAPTYPTTCMSAETKPNRQYLTVILDTNRAVILALQGELTQSQELLTSVLQTHPESLGANKALIWVLLRQAKTADALRRIRAVSRLVASTNQ